jgi:hypothetical protein
MLRIEHVFFRKIHPIIAGPDWPEGDESTLQAFERMREFSDHISKLPEFSDDDLVELEQAASALEAVGLDRRARTLGEIRAARDTEQVENPVAAPHGSANCQDRVSNARFDIPPEMRTRPMTLSEAARFMGYTKGRKGSGNRAPAQRVSDGIKRGAIPAIRRNRQTYIFHIDYFPAATLKRVSPSE